ncbi:MAG TPA: hypothetical protein VJM33_02220 [Microthrixaceae bacterium]|nr:hypothetical protein [Microthrixaceae bacterium]
MGCGCLLALGSLALPRVTLFFLWLFTERLSIAFDSFVLGFLGFLLLPYTTVFYALAYQPLFGVSGFGWFIVAMGFLLDLGALFGGGREGRRRYAEA